MSRLGYTLSSRAAAGFVGTSHGVLPYRAAAKVLDAALIFAHNSASSLPVGGGCGSGFFGGLQQAGWVWVQRKTGELEMLLPSA
jgi:hypothetical protein